MNPKTPWKILWIPALIVILDQFSKFWVIQALALYEWRPVIPCVGLTHLRNRGAAFSFLSQASGWQNAFLIAFAVFASILLLYWLFHIPMSRKAERTAVALILGGAMGNLLDRIIHGAVVDFIDIYFRQWHWPAFNGADSAIAIGTMVMVWVLFLSGERHLPQTSPDDPDS